MLQFTNGLFLVGAFALILDVVPTVIAYVEHRREKATPFRNYFGAECDRELCRRGFYSETEEWLADCHAPFAAFRHRDPGANKQR
jgi:hypothetical protein